MSSSQTAQLTRRGVVRGVAWSVPVVAVAATAPAFAASRRRTIITPGAPTKWGTGNEKHVQWDMLIDNGPVAIQSISITFTYAPTSAGPFTQFEIYGYPPSPTPRDYLWTYLPITAPTTTLTVTHGTIAANTTYNLHTDFGGGDNAAGTVQADFVIVYAQGAGTDSSQAFGPITWESSKSDKQHSHPLT